MPRLDGRVALVTGAGRNIGLAIAQTLARAGAAVVCNGLHAENVERAAAGIRAAGGRAIAVPGDVRVPDDVERALDAGESRFGTVDVLVNNAATTVKKPLLALELDEWDEVLDVALTGTFLCARAFARRLIASRRPGVVVNIGSTSGHFGRAASAPYAAAKGAVGSLTRALALELAPHGIRVCSVSPTRTGAPTGPAGTAPPRAADGIPLGRTGTPEDQANAVLFLVSEAAGFVTGEDLRVDGGALAAYGPPG